MEAGRTVGNLFVTGELLNLGFKVSKPVINQFYKVREFNFIEDTPLKSAEFKSLTKIGDNSLKVQTRVRPAGDYNLPVYNVRETTTPFFTTSSIQEVGTIKAISRQNIFKTFGTDTAGITGKAEISGYGINTRKSFFTGTAKDLIGRQTTKLTGEDYLIKLRRTNNYKNARAEYEIVKLNAFKPSYKFKNKLVESEINLLRIKRGFETDVFKTQSISSPKIKQTEIDFGAIGKRKVNAKQPINFNKVNNEGILVVEKPSYLGNPKVSLYDPLKRYSRQRVARPRATISNINKFKINNLEKTKINKIVNDLKLKNGSSDFKLIEASNVAGSQSLNKLISSVKYPTKSISVKLPKETGLVLGLTNKQTTKNENKIIQRLDNKLTQRQTQRLNQRQRNLTRVSVRTSTRQEQRLNQRQEQRLGLRLNTRLTQRQSQRLENPTNISPPGFPPFVPKGFGGVPFKSKKQKVKKIKDIKFLEKGFGITPTLYESIYLNKRKRKRQPSYNLKNPPKFTGLEASRLL